MLEYLIFTINRLPNETIYLFLLFNAFIEYFFPPFPSDTIMVFSAYLAGTGKLDFLTAYVISLAGSTGGFLGLFLVGKCYGRDFFFEKNYRFLPREALLRIEGWFRNYGIGLIAANRFISGARSAVALFAGISNTKFASAAAAGFVSCLLWNTILLCGGYYLGKNWQRAATLLKQYNTVVIILIILFVACLLWMRKRRKTQALDRSPKGNRE
jgi:membrane protein DedA with SNARE-associated domain